MASRYDSSANNSSGSSGLATSLNRMNHKSGSGVQNSDCTKANAGATTITAYPAGARYNIGRTLKPDEALKIARTSKLAGVSKFVAASKPVGVSKVVGASKTVGLSPKLPSTTFSCAQLELAFTRIAGLREARQRSEATITELREQRDKFDKIVKTKSNILFCKNREIEILKSNAFMDQVALKQRDDRIAALRNRLVERGQQGYDDDMEMLERDKKKLSLDIVNLGRVKRELMDEIESLEIEKEKLEFE